MIKLVGFCPMGCGQTLAAGDRGSIFCSQLGCPNPTAVGTILADQETEHLVAFERTDFKIKHPLRERINDELLDCALHTEIAGLSGPPVAPGTWRVHAVGYTSAGPVWKYAPVEPGV